MYEITKSFTICYGHRLFGDPGKCGHLHGHTARVDVTLAAGALNKLGMVENFDIVKETVGSWLEKNLDHKTVLNKADPLGFLLEKAGEKIYLTESNPTAETLARIIFEAARVKDLPVVKVAFWESPTSCAVYTQIITDSRRR